LTGGPEGHAIEPAFRVTIGRMFSSRAFTLFLLTPLAAAGLMAADGGAPNRDAAALQSAPAAALVPDPPMSCGSCAEWNAPRQPFRVFGNTYYVGSMGLSSVLIVSNQGLILVDVALPQTAPLIDANIRALGYRTSDVKYILTSHAHFDHVGGVRSMQRFTGATVVASAASARALALGHPTPDDPQYAGPGSTAQDFPAVANARVVADGEILRLGSVAVTAHYTPGHTPGSTSWAWQSCEGSRCLNLVYADSLTAVSNDTFRFMESGGAPGIMDSFRGSVRKVGALACDVLLTTHPAASGMDEKVKARAADRSRDPFVDAGACKALAERALKGLDERAAAESRK
jgi:metallo-beta-lactamase class B